MSKIYDRVEIVRQAMVTELNNTPDCWLVIATVTAVYPRQEPIPC